MGCRKLLTGSLVKQELVVMQSMSASLGSWLQSVLDGCPCTADNIHRIDRSSLNMSLCLKFFFAGSSSLHAVFYIILSRYTVRMRIVLVGKFCANKINYTNFEL